MILKTADDKSSSINELEQLAATASSNLKPSIEQELRQVRAGVKGEREAAYLIDFDFGQKPNSMVIHDLRLEAKGRVAQIDHLIINRLLDFIVLETKHFSSGVKITEEGEFLRWNGYKKCYEGMASPLAQNDRHIQVLKDVLSEIDMPTRLGLRLTPTFHSYVLVGPEARIDRPTQFDSSRVIKADALKKAWEKSIDDTSLLGAFGSVAKVVSLETIVDIGKRLVALHRPIKFDYAKRFGLSQTSSEAGPAANTSQPALAVGPEKSEASALQCRACGGGNLTIQYGKYGYYFKCANCDGNTPIKISCGVAGHKERIRKDGTKFFRECEGCGTSALFFENAVRPA